MEDCSHAFVQYNDRMGAHTCLTCRRTSYELYQRWCAVCAGWQTMLILVGPEQFACGRCQTAMPSNTPRRKEIRWF